LQAFHMWCITAQNIRMVLQCKQGDAFHLNVT
jgi:hypothetical protein